MSVYVRKRGMEEYFLGFAFPLQPLMGHAEYALPFPSAEAAYACTPEAIHTEMEVVDESVRRKDAQTGLSEINRPAVQISINNSKLYRVVA